MSENYDTDRLLSKRRFLNTSLALGGATLLSGTGAASKDDDTELQKVDENDTYVLFEVASNDGTRYFKSNKQTGTTTFVESDELVNDYSIAESNVSISAVPEPAGVEIVVRSDTYERVIESCAGDCGGHSVVGTSHELNEYLAGATKATIAYAIISAALAVAPATGAVAAVGSATARGAVKAAIAGASTKLLEGNSFTVATVDTAIKYFFGVQETAYLGTSLGGWKPGGSSLLLSSAPPLTEHQYGCS